LTNAIKDAKNPEGNGKIKVWIFFSLQNSKKEIIRNGINFENSGEDFQITVENKIKEKIASFEEDNYIPTDISYRYEIPYKDKDDYVILRSSSLPIFEKSNGEFALSEI